jgi:replicative DNA helicase
MKLWSTKHEIRALITVLDAEEDVSSFLLGKLKPAHFGYDPTKEIFQRLRNLIKSGKSLPSRNLLKDDPALSDSARNVLASKLNPLDNGNDASSLLQVLNDYRRIRSVYEGSQETVRILKSQDVDSDKLDAIIKKLDKCVKKALTSDHDNIQAIGTGSTSRPILDSILDPTRRKFIPTGIPMFDAQNGGWSRGSLVTLAANSGGGKSVMALQVAINQYRAGYKVVYVSMEMSTEEVYERIVSNVTCIDFSQILLKKLTIKQEKLIRRKWKEFESIGKDANTFFKVWVPTEGVSLSNIINTISPLKPDIIYIDMINLLDPEDKTNQNQAQNLGESSRYAKIAANATGAVVVLLAQLNEEDKVKYARAIVENSNNVWSWFMGDKEKETHFFTIKQTKARNQKTFDVFMVEDFAHMSLSGRDSGTTDETAMASANDA